MLTFREFYEGNYHHAEPGEHWAGANFEPTADVLRRLADALAAYADYVREQLERG